MSGWPLDQVAAVAAAEIPDGSYVNLGIGLPELIANHLPADREILLHSENGIMGMGPKPPPDDEDGDLINAGKKPVTLLPGGSYFHQADSFAMIRGGHIDLCFMGAFEVSMAGDLANWSTGGDGPPAVGGAMDLATGAGAVRILTTHTTKGGGPKLVRALTLPVTGRRMVARVYTDLAVLDPAGDRFVVRRLAPGVDMAMLAAATGAPVA